MFWFTGVSNLLRLLEQVAWKSRVINSMFVEDAEDAFPNRYSWPTSPSHQEKPTMYIWLKYLLFDSLDTPCKDAEDAGFLDDFLQSAQNIVKFVKQGWCFMTRFRGFPEEHRFLDVAKYVPWTPWCRLLSTSLTFFLVQHRSQIQWTARLKVETSLIKTQQQHRVPTATI